MLPVMEPNELILRWRFRIHRMQLAHYETARVFDHHHLWLGLPVIILSTVVGTTVFATIQKSAQTDNVPWLQILVGLLSVLAAVLASLQTFLRFSELAEKHRVAGARFAALKHEIELIIAMPPSSPDKLREVLTELDQRWSKLREDSPNVPRKIWRRIERNLSYEEHTKS